MTDPSFQLRVPNSGEPVTGTPGNALAFDSTGRRVEGVPFPSGFDVAGTPAIGKVVGWDGTQPIWENVPTAFAITGFAQTGAALVLVGSTVANPSFTAAYNQPAASVTLSDTDGNSQVIALPGTAFASTHSYTKTVVGQSVTFTDTATSALGSDAKSVTKTWGQNVYTGSAVDPGGGGYNAAFIQAFAATLKLGPQGTYAENASALQSVFFCVRTAAGATTANFFVGGFPFACSRVATGIPVTVNSVTENFDIFRSDNVGLGAFSLVYQ